MKRAAVKLRRLAALAAALACSHCQPPIPAALHTPQPVAIPTARVAPANVADPSSQAVISKAWLLRDVGQLDAALVSIRAFVAERDVAEQHFYELELQLLMDLDTHGQIELAKRILADLQSPVAANLLASKRLRDPAVPPAPTARQAELLATRGIGSLATDVVLARATLDKALHAYMRLAQQPPTAIALRATYESVAPTGPSLNIAATDVFGTHQRTPIAIEVETLPGDQRSLVLGSVSQTTRFRGFGDAIVSGYRARLSHHIELLNENVQWDAYAGLVLLSGAPGARWVTHGSPAEDTFDKPLEPVMEPLTDASLAQARSIMVLQSGLAVVVTRDALHLLPRDKGAPSSIAARLESPHHALTLAHRRYWVMCHAKHPVVVVDSQAAAATIQLPAAKLCVVDDARQQLIVVPHAQTANPGRTRVQLLPLDGSAGRELELPDVTAAESAFFWISPHAGLVQLQGWLVDLAAAKRLRRVADPYGVVNPGSAQLLRSIKAMVKPPHELLPQRGTDMLFRLSDDQKTAVALSYDTSVVDEKKVELLIVDVPSRRLRHRLSTRFGVATVSFRIEGNNHLMVANTFRTQDRFTQVFDLHSGDELLSPRINDVCADARVQGDLFFCGAAVSQLDGKQIALGIAERDDELSEVTFDAAGKVTIHANRAPRWLHCAFGDHLAPWPVCAPRLLAAVVPPED